MLMISIRVNGESRDVPSGWTVADLVGQLQVQSRYCAVELNRKVVPRETWSEVLLAAGCELEVVTLTGGG
ncbi:MAG: sulfur carrier protein ThiS [Planctomycetota bacterium]|jgi:thiamine biosynthesis protein ThiS